MDFRSFFVGCAEDEKKNKKNFIVFQKRTIF